MHTIARNGIGLTGALALAQAHVKYLRARHTAPCRPFCAKSDHRPEWHRPPGCAFHEPLVTSCAAFGPKSSALVCQTPAGRMGGRKHKDKKKHKKARRTPQTTSSNLQPVWAPQFLGMSPTMAAMPSMGGMLALQAPAPPPQQEHKESSDSSSSSDSNASRGSGSPSSSDSAYRRKKYNKTAKAKLTVSASELGGLPTVRLGEALERCDSRLDPTVTGAHKKKPK